MRRDENTKKKTKTELSSEPPSGVDVWLRDDDEFEDDIFHWECSIVGPPDTLLYVFFCRLRMSIFLFDVTSTHDISKQ